MNAMIVITIGSSRWFTAFASVLSKIVKRVWHSTSHEKHFRSNETEYDLHDLKSDTLNHRTINTAVWSRQKSTPPTLPPIPPCYKLLTILQTRQQRVTLQFRTPASPPPLLSVTT